MSERPGGPAAQLRDYLALLPSGPDAVHRLRLHRFRATQTPELPSLVRALTSNQAPAGRQLRRPPAREDQTLFTRHAFAGDVERRSVIDRHAHDRQPDRDVDAVVAVDLVGPPPAGTTNRFWL